MKSRNFMGTGAAIAAAVCVVSLGSWWQASALTQTMTFSLVGIHPEAAAETTAGARVIRDMAVDNNKLIVGYGDWNANTGPTVINPFDLTTETFDGPALTVSSESISNIRSINGALYVPSIDMLGAAGSMGYATNVSGTWQYVENTSMTDGVHTFDVASSDGSDIWMFGSKVHPTISNASIATAWRSTDGGATWTEMTTDYLASASSKVSRYHYGASLNGKIYTQARAGLPATVGPMKAYDGVSWTDDSATSEHCPYNSGGQLIEFTSKLVCIGDRHNVQLNSFDGSVWEAVSIENNQNVIDTYVGDDGYLYVLTAYLYAPQSYGIYRSADLDNWEEITRIDESTMQVASFAIADNYVYLGTRNSQILKSDITITNAVSTIPTLPAEECYEMSGGTITEYYETLGDLMGAPACPGGHVTIPDTIDGQTVTAIGPNAFEDRNITAVDLPATLTSIGNYAFRDNQIEDITLHEGITYIGWGSFSNNRLKTVAIPDSVTTLREYAFSSNYITDVTLGSGITSIPRKVFSANSISSVEIPTGVVSYDDSAFEYQSSYGKDLFDLSINDVQDALWYVVVHTENPANPNNFQSTVYHDGYVYSGYLINPAKLEVRYLNNSGQPVSDELSVVGKVDGEHINSYMVQDGPSIPLPTDPHNIQPSEQNAMDTVLRSAYLGVGDTVTITPPAVQGYITPPPRSFDLTSAIVEESIVYDVDPSGLQASDNNTKLTDTGTNMWLIAIGGVSAILCAAIFAACSYGHKITKRIIGG